MALLIPFKALRPHSDVAARVAAVPYDVVNSGEARALASDPLSFLHVSRAEIDLPPGTNPYSDEVYAKAADNFTSLKTSAPLVVDDRPSAYVYRLRTGGHVQTGVAACYSLDEYERDVIKKHERTRREKEDDRTRHMLTLQAQTGPVFLAYKASFLVDAVVGRAVAGAPMYDFAAVDGVQHTLWSVDAADELDLVEAFRAVPALYIADGHHRAASAARARRELGGASGDPGSWDSFLGVAFPDNQMQILAYNRVVRDLASRTPATLLKDLQKLFTVREGPAVSERRGEVAMFLDEQWFTITLGEPPAKCGAAERLDVSRLQDQVLGPLLDIGDVRTDKRIDFVGGARGASELEALVRSGAFGVAFSMFPVSVIDLIAISDAGDIMPPKSTWFEPKLRDGLLSHLI